MNDGLIPRRYAKALFKVAAEQNLQQRLYQLMTNLSASFRALPALKEVIDNPCQAADDKIMLLTTAASADPVTDQLYIDFLHLMLKNNRLDMIESAALAYCSLYRRENHIRVVTVTTAAPMPQQQMDRLKSFITKELKGDSMEFTSSVDPSLTGGFVVTVDNERLDASISNELKQLRLKLLSKQS